VTEPTTVGTVLGLIQKGSDLRLDVEDRIRALVARGRSDDDICDELVDTLSQRPELVTISDPAVLRSTIQLLIGPARKGR